VEPTGDSLRISAPVSEAVSWACDDVTAETGASKISVYSVRPLNCTCASD
jgi:hypothetical protein